MNYLKTTYVKSCDKQLNADEMIKDFQPNNQKAFYRYLNDIWKELYKNSDDTIKGMNYFTFAHYYKLPPMLSKRLFTLFNISKSGYISKIEFINGMMLLFTGYFDKISRLMFSMFDFDNNGIICQEDMRLVLSYMPLRNSQYIPSDQFPNEHKTFADQLIANEEIGELLRDMFQKNEMKYDYYLQFIEVFNSKAFVYLLITLYDAKPFSFETIHYYSSFPELVDIPEYLQFDKETSNRKGVKIAVPPVISKFKAFESLLNSSYVLKFIAHADMKKITGKFQMKILRGDLSVPISSQHHSQSHTLTHTQPDKEKENGKENNKEKDKAVQETIESLLSIDFNPNIEGYINKLTKNNTLKKVYMKIINQDLFFFNNEKDKYHKSIKNLSYVFLREENSKNSNKEHHILQLVFQKKIVTFYFDTEMEYYKWTKALKIIINFKDINDYDIKDKVGIGKYGLVRRALHKKSRRKVAIKFIEKKLMTFQELDLLKTEQDILNFITHPNLIQVYDIIDTADFCYIITEYLHGGDLHSYLERKDYKIHEALCCQIVHQICTGTYYLHYYGILHRDLKPEHLLLVNANAGDEIEIKFIDFGLATFIGPTEKRIEPYGTIGYIAPEVLGVEFYDKTCEIWTIGVIAYLLLVGCLPFDDEHSEQEIKRQILNEEVYYPYQLWKKISIEASFFVENSLRKSPLSRLTLKKILRLPWFDKFTKSKLIQKRINADYTNELLLHSLSDENQIEPIKEKIKQSILY